jgi:hypothetical protein
MSEKEGITKLTAAQLKKASIEVRDLARRLGVNFVTWDQVRELMETSQLDLVELSDFLANSVVREKWVMLGVMRYRVESEDAAERIASATVSVHADVMTIEVVALKLKGVPS